jgi:superfamily II DNA or RNA helicase
VPGEVRAGVNAAGGKSVIKALQRLGRGMRVAEGKSGIAWTDFSDIGHPWLEKHSKARVNAYKTEGYEVSFVPLHQKGK